ncbi:anaphase-promoting complex subunit 4 long domain-containing protein [Absidia repens]|uniref:Anaphase-promoting complex subunit 4 n=1 Tax=Absidia repens TaxID=90262 RepID=A0A1X2I508_9FUNG|nr:anaphase-promoting complex subunit 4 long domain-containing protein [Absidia repens]
MCSFVYIDDAIPLPQVELLGLLATGNLNPAVHEYLSGGELDQQKAKQWETKSMHSYTNVQRIIVEYLQPACERLLLQLSKLRGYGLWTKRYGELICNDSVAAAIKLTQQYMWTMEQLLKSVGQVSRRFQEFILWIYRGSGENKNKIKTDV